MKYGWNLANREILCIFRIFKIRYMLSVIQHQALGEDGIESWNSDLGILS